MEKEQKELICPKVDLNLILDTGILIPKLLNSLELQKSFIKEIYKSLDDLENETAQNFISITLGILPEIIPYVGIPFTFYLFKNSEKVEKFIDFIIEQEYKTSEIFTSFFQVFNFSFNNNPLMNYTQKLSEYIDEEIPFSGLVSKEQQLYEELAFLGYKWKEVRLIGDENDFVNELNNNLSNIIDDFKSFNRDSNFYPANKEFYQELIQEIIDFRNERSSKNKKGIEMSNLLNEQKIKNIPLSSRTFFYKDEIIKENKNEVTEFKNYALPLNSQNEKELKRQYCGFLNSKGGRLYLGINDQKIVKGIVLNYKTRDLLKNTLVNLTSDFYPKCRLSKVVIYFIPIKKLENQSFLKDLFIIKIRIYSGEPNILYSMTNKGYNSCIRINDKFIDLSATEIYNEILKRESIVPNSTLFKDEEIRDPEPEVNPQELEENNIFIKGYKRENNINKSNWNYNSNAHKNIMDNDNKINRNIWNCYKPNANEKSNSNKVYKTNLFYDIENKNDDMMKENKIYKTNWIIKNKNDDNDEKKKSGKKSSKFIKDNFLKGRKVTIKVSNIDKDLTTQEVNKFFNGCGCSSQKFFIQNSKGSSGYGYLNFSKFEDAEKCFNNFNNFLLGSKVIRMKIIENE